PFQIAALDERAPERTERPGAPVLELQRRELRDALEASDAPVQVTELDVEVTEIRRWPRLRRQEPALLRVFDHLFPSIEGHAPVAALEVNVSGCEEAVRLRPLVADLLPDPISVHRARLGFLKVA